MVAERILARIKSLSLEFVLITRLTSRINVTNKKATYIGKMWGLEEVIPFKIMQHFRLYFSYYFVCRNVERKYLVVS